MRRYSSILLGTLAAGVLGTAVCGGGRAWASGAGRSFEVAQQASPCLIVATKSADPHVVLLGEATRLTMRVMATCAGEVYPLHIVLVLDESNSMAGEKIQQLQKAAGTLVRRLDLEANPATLIGVVGFNDRARTLTDLTNETNRAVAALNRLRAAGNTAIDRGIVEGMKVLAKGRDKQASLDEATEVMIVLSDGQNNGGPGPVLKAAAQAKNQGVLLVTICVGSDCDAATMRAAATSPRYYFEVERAEQIIDVLERIRAMIRRIALRQLSVKDVLPDNMRYVPSSAEPQPSTISPRGDVLAWETNMVAESGITFTLWVEPLEPGFWPTNVEAGLTFLDSRNRGGSVTFEVPWVNVLAPEPVQTPTVPQAPPTVTPVVPSRTPTPTATSAPTAVPTATPRPVPLYLPVAIWFECSSIVEHADIALVLDVSTSMLRGAPAASTKLAATLATARELVGMLQLEPDAAGNYDQVAIVGFNGRAWIEQSLTSDPAAALSAVDRLAFQVAEYTRLDLALIRGTEALTADERRSGNTMALILLTDGLPNRVPMGPDGTMESTVLAAAASAKGQEISVFTIAIGAPGDTYEALMKAIATDPSHYYYDPDPAALTAVYSQIVRRLRCPAERFGWPPSAP